MKHFFFTLNTFSYKRITIDIIIIGIMIVIIYIISFFDNKYICNKNYQKFFIIYLSFNRFNFNSYYVQFIYFLFFKMNNNRD